jgi:uncharacterized protein (DUF2141 family)
MAMLWVVASNGWAQQKLHVEVILNKPDAGGVLRIALCPNKAAYDSETGCTLASVPAQGRSVRAIFNDVAPGTYAAKVFHDINADEKLNTSWVGWPQEPYGFSNDAPVNMGPPSFKLAAFAMPERDHTIRIALR